MQDSPISIQQVPRTLLLLERRASIPFPFIIPFDFDLVAGGSSSGVIVSSDRS